LAVEIDLQRFYRINRRVFMWVVFFGCLFLLRDFFPVMFLTFIFGFLMRSVAKFLATRTRAPYWAAVVFPYLAVLTLLVLLTVTAVPRVVKEASDFSRDLPGLLNDLATNLRDSARQHGLEGMLAKYVNAAVEESGTLTSEGARRSESSAASQTPADESGANGTPGTETGEASPMGAREPARAATAGADHEPAANPAEINVKALVKTMQEFGLALLPGMQGESQRAGVINLLDKFVRGVFTGSLQFLLAILLSFLIVLDYEAIAAELNKWRENQIGQFFHEAAASVVDFSGVVGRAFQCQILVALLNASITCIGMSILGIGPLLLLTTIVFLLGLIPVLGVFISSVPIILIAFNKGSLTLALLALGVIVIVHLLEAYVFNPRIYAARFHLNPVIVLIILLVAHQLFGIWGMLLGIPVTTYVLSIAQIPALSSKHRQRKQKGRFDPAGKSGEAQVSGDH
jgi:predicted PurR-regulated permease PerM